MRSLRDCYILNLDRAKAVSAKLIFDTAIRLLLAADECRDLDWMPSALGCLAKLDTAP